jgi:tetratricopeptide (TPR) repeat protein
MMRFRRGRAVNEAAPVSNEQSRAARSAFISYATADRKRALALCKAIEQRGARCWISCRDVSPGANYQEAIVRAIRDARAVVLVFSRAANNSDEIKKELSLASRFRVPVMALRIEDVEPSDAFAYELSTRQWIDAFEDRDRSIDALVREMAELSEQSKGPQEGVRSSGTSRGIKRRRLLIGGGAAIAASAAGIAWFETSRDSLPSEAKRLIDEGHAALDEATVEQFATAVARFRQATEIAPNRAEPWGGLAIAYERQAWLASAPEDQSLHTRADHARRRALSIDPDNGDALDAGVAATPMFGNWPARERASQTALQRQPRHAGLNMELAWLLTNVGRIADTPPLIDRALASNPKFVFAHLFKIGNLADLNRFDEVEAAVETAYRLWPRHYAIWFARLYYFAYNNRATEALAIVDDQTRRPLGIPEWNFAILRLQVKALQTRAKADVDAAIESSLDSARRGAGFAESAILFAGEVGRVDDAYRIIDAYFFGRGFDVGQKRWSTEQGMFNAHRRRNTYFLFKSFMQPVRADPRFPALTAELGLDDYWKKSGSVPDYRAHASA